MSSFGEANIMLEIYNMGTVRVLALHSVTKLYPRLGVRLGITLRDGPEQSGCRGTLTLTGITGELRLQRDSDAFGVLHWMEHRQTLRSSPHGIEEQVELVCELDPWRVERIERHRDGKEPLLWMQLWPQALGNEGYVQMNIDLVLVTPPRDRWIEFLNEVRDASLEAIEALYPVVFGGTFRAALQHTRKARRLIDTGQYDEAIACCRRAVEALQQELPRMVTDCRGLCRRQPMRGASKSIRGSSVTLNS